MHFFVRIMMIQTQYGSFQFVLPAPKNCFPERWHITLVLCEVWEFEKPQFSQSTKVKLKNKRTVYVLPPTFCKTLCCTKPTGS